MNKKSLVSILLVSAMSLGLMVGYGASKDNTKADGKYNEIVGQYIAK